MPPSIWLRTVGVDRLAAVDGGHDAHESVGRSRGRPRLRRPGRNRRRGSCSARRRSRGRGLRGRLAPLPSRNARAAVAITSRARGSSRCAQAEFAPDRRRPPCASSSMKLSIENTFMCAPSERIAETRSGMLRQEMVDDAARWARVERNRVAVAAAFGHRDRLRRRRRRTAWPDLAAGEQRRRRSPGASIVRVAPHLVVASRRCCRRVERALDLDHHRRAERLPAVLLFAHPLHAHRPAGHARARSARRRRRRRRRRYGRSSPSLRRGCSAPAPGGMRSISRARCAADRRPGVWVHTVTPPSFEQRHRAGRPDRAVHQVGPRVASPSASLRRAGAGVPGSRIGHVLRRQALQRRVADRSGSGSGAPSRSQRAAGERAHRLDRPAIRVRRRRRGSCRRARPSRTPGILSTASVSTSAQRGAVARRPHHARMHHAGQAHVLHIGRAAGDLGREYRRAARLADHR